MAKTEFHTYWSALNALLRLRLKRPASFNEAQCNFAAGHSITEAAASIENYRNSN